MIPLFILAWTISLVAFFKNKIQLINKMRMFWINGSSLCYQFLLFLLLWSNKNGTFELTHYLLSNISCVKNLLIKAYTKCESHKNSISVKEWKWKQHVEGSEIFSILTIIREIVIAFIDLINLFFLMIHCRIKNT